MTNKIVLRTVDQYMAGYTPVYAPIHTLFMQGAVKYTEEVGTQTFRRVETVGDIRAKHITPKDTELKQIAVGESSKTFKKFFLANQFVQSQFQDQQGVEDMIAQVLDEHLKQADDIFLGDSINSGLYTSSDTNYLLENSYEVQKDADSNYLLDLHAKVLVEAEKANINAGRKVLMWYGSTILPVYNSIYAAAVRPFKSVLAEVLGSDYSLMQMPSDITPAGANGFIIANMEQIKLHWTAMPQLKARGLNEENQYYWFNFLMGSMMLDCKVSKAIIRQPLTLEA
jgi:hypothetical protein